MSLLTIFGEPFFVRLEILQEILVKRMEFKKGKMVSVKMIVWSTSIAWSSELWTNICNCDVSFLKLYITSMKVCTHTQRQFLMLLLYPRTLKLEAEVYNVYISFRKSARELAHQTRKKILSFEQYDVVCKWIYEIWTATWICWTYSHL